MREHEVPVVILEEEEGMPPLDQGQDRPDLRRRQQGGARNPDTGTHGAWNSVPTATSAAQPFYTKAPHRRQG